MLNRRSFLTALVSCPICAGAARAADAPHWEYDGEHGAPHWGDMSPEFKACTAGTEQSPIDLKNAIPARADRLAIAWKKETYQVVNNGHTIQLNSAGGSALRIGALKYDLKQFHFHTPSEHAFGGSRTAMEVHFVHAHETGRLAVVGVLMVSGRAHKGFSEIMATAPAREGESRLRQAIDPDAFLPKQRDLYRYEGSLTTPPCSEVVDWNVLAKTIEVAPADIAKFKALFPMNARPLQPLNRRYLLRV